MATNGKFAVIVIEPLKGTTKVFNRGQKMSYDLENAEMCKGDKCTNLLTSRHEAKRGLCLICYDEEIEKVKLKQDAIYDHLKTGLDMILKRPN